MTRLLALILAALLMTACATKKVTTEAIKTTTKELVVKQDTTQVETTTTTTINQRLVEVEIPLPQTNLQTTTHDTTSTLEDDYYISTASVKDRILRHTLQSKPPAKLKGSVLVNDTTREKTIDTKQVSNQQQDKQQDNDTTKEKNVKTTTDFTIPVLLVLIIAALLALYVCRMTL